MRRCLVLVLACGSTFGAGCQPTVSIGRIDPAAATTTQGAPQTSADEATGSIDGTSATAGEPTETEDLAGQCGLLIEDSACAECLRGSCCAVLEACAEQPSCPCLLQCYVVMPDQEQCTMACPIDPEATPSFNEAVACAAEACAIACFMR